MVISQVVLTKGYNSMKEVRMDRLIEVAQRTRFTLDCLYDLSLGLDDKAFATFCGNALSSPK